MADPGSIGSAMLPSEDTRGRDIADIKRDIRELGPSVARSFKPVFDAINAQIAQMNAIQVEQAAQLVALNAAVALQVLPATGHAEASNYSLSTTPQELTRITFTVPAGYTRAQVMGATVVGCFNRSSVQGDVIRARLDISGNYASVPSPTYVGMIELSSATSVFATVLTGLTGGSTFYVRSVAWNDYGNTGAAYNLNAANIDATVLFLR